MMEEDAKVGDLNKISDLRSITPGLIYIANDQNDASTIEINLSKEISFIKSANKSHIQQAASSLLEFKLAQTEEENEKINKRFCC